MTEGGVVWTVEWGEYSDYRVLGVFSTEANARAVADKRNVESGYGDARVVKRSVDAGMAGLRAGMSRYFVCMDRDGRVEEVELEPWEPERAADDASEVSIRHGLIHAMVLARDEKHAVKIVNEKRLMLKARGDLNPKYGP